MVLNSISYHVSLNVSCFALSQWDACVHDMWKKRLKGATHILPENSRYVKRGQMLEAEARSSRPRQRPDAKAKNTQLYI